MSLRARLVIGVLGVAAFGLVLAGAVTYAEQRSFLEDRVDQQVEAATPAVRHALEDRGAGIEVPGGRGPFGARPGSGGPGGRPDPRGVSLPPGTYGQSRDATGEVLGSVVLTYGERALPEPDLPEQMPAGEVITVGSKGRSGLEYRAVSEPAFGGLGATVVAVPLQEVDRTLDRLLRIEALVIGGVLAVLAVLSWLVVGVGLRPLDRIGRTAGAIAAGDLSRRVDPATPRTEVGRLGMALNAMLTRLEGAFAEREASEDRLRRFLADASHELRTPLASIRGYAELHRIGALDEGEDTEQAMRRIEDEAERMGVLVEDLLMLARLDEVREAEREEVDLAALAGDAIADARATDPGRAIELQAAGPAIVLGDPHQLRAVFGNLLRNALVHTPSGTPVEVSVGVAGGRAQVAVRDHGPGLPDADPDELFERFWRTEQGRRRGRAGAGLGLAIVAGIVAAHDGRVSARNAPGGGALFVVELPAAAGAHEARPAGHLW